MNYYFKFYRVTLAAAVSLLVAPMLAAQAPDNRITVPLSDPTRPASVRAHLLNGSITVKGADVKEILVEARARHEDSRNEGRA